MIRNELLRDMDCSMDCKTKIEYVIKFSNYTLETEDKTVLLHNITCGFPKNGLIALVGSRGAGKTALLKRIAGICADGHTTYGDVLAPDRNGRISQRDIKVWASRAAYHAPDMERPQKALSVFAVLRSVAVLHKKNIKLVDELLFYFKLQSLRDAKLSHLSHSEQKTVTFIIRILEEKDVNMWDDPLSGLTNEEVHSRLSFIRSRKSTDIVSLCHPTQDVIEAFDWVVFLHASTVIYSGPEKDMRCYFEWYGIYCCANRLFSGYLIQISADISKNQIDAENIARLSNLTVSILNKPRGLKTGKSILFMRSCAVDRQKVEEILKRSLRFNITNLMFLVLLGIFANFTIFIFVGSCTLETRKLFEKTQYLNDLNESVNYYENVLSVLQTIDLENSSFFQETRKYIYSLVRVSGSIEWTNWILSPMAGALGAFYFLCDCFMLSYMGAHENYLRCKEDISKGAFTVVEFLAAFVIEKAVSKFFVPFICNVLFYLILHFWLLSNKMREVISYTMVDYAFALLSSMFVYFLYALSIELALMCFLSKRALLLKIAVFVYTAVYFLEILSDWKVNSAIQRQQRIYEPDFLKKYTISETTGDPPISLYNSRIFNKKSAYISQLAKSAADEKNAYFYPWFLEKLSYVLWFMCKTGPGIVFEEVMYKIGLYRNYFSEPATLPSSSALDEFIQRTEHPLKTADLIRRLYLLLAYMKKPHDILDRNFLLRSVGVFSIVVTIVRCSLLPLCILTVVGYISYRKTQPAYRN
ncbi:hypothetical protein NEMIN01_1998 [Nematocida minor]|uniref:uncharacterized protein n=1 Tax=Nematocida minor TaxID=1912983 RepID=UPI00221E3E2F|nr:uncharacterized protein NEMIN01_1998 [Nematocida minor]KAI5192411.1 hypothetical protein NEMIN01_1998 [Nematocida minor]